MQSSAFAALASSLPPADASIHSAMSQSVTSLAHRVLTTAKPLQKVALTKEAFSLRATTPLLLPPHPNPPIRPSRPELPSIIPSSEMPSVKNSPLPPNVYYLHLLAHVELNAIDLCFDTMLRFIHGLQEVDVREWCEDWISIADDEARHFSMLDGRLHELGYEYGCLPAHDMIWQSAKVSEASRRTRLALGQLVAEARGLDAGPKLAARLTGLGDIVSAKIVSQIAVEEVRHVEIGVKWFVRECEKEGEDAVHAFHEIAMKYANPSAFAGPFERERRREAGMTEEWYEPVAEMMMKERERRRRERNANADVAEGIKA